MKINTVKQKLVEVINEAKIPAEVAELILENLILSLRQQMAEAEAAAEAEEAKAAAEAEEKKGDKKVGKDT